MGAIRSGDAEAVAEAGRDADADGGCGGERIMSWPTQML